MMGVYIKGMDVPDRCFACPLCFGEDDDWSCAISHGAYIEYRTIETDIAIDTRPDWCPLVPVPKHGRLIDEDELVKVMSEGIAPSVKGGGFKHPFDILRAIANAPTIIPASEE